MRFERTWTRLFRLAFWLGVGGLVLVSLTPGKSLPRIEHDLLYHAASYAGLALLAALGHDSERTTAYAFAGLVILGAALELAQNFVAGRTGSVDDLLANAAGVCVVTLLRALYRHRRRKGISGR